MEKPDTIMILGASQMQEPAMRRAKELGFRVLSVDGNPNAAFAALADVFEPVDLKDLDGLEAAAAKPHGEGRLAGVMTAGTDFSASVAFLTERFGLPGTARDSAIAASDKGVMRERLARAGVSCPGFAVALDPDEAVAAFERLACPVVVKPVDSMGARGCVRADTQAQVRAATVEALRHSRSAAVIVEEYIEGPEFSIDALVYDGTIAICGVADRTIRFAPHFVEMGHTMPSSCGREVGEEVLRVFREGVKALGISHGAAKGDIKYRDGRAYVGEIAARLSGGYMSGWTFPYSSGVDLTGMAVLLSTGRRPADVEPSRSWTSAERAFISIPGRIGRISGILGAERLPFVKNVFLRVGTGDEVAFPVNNVQKCGNVISQAPTRAEAVEAAESAVAGVFLRLEPCNALTDGYLGGLGASFPPDAFDPGERAMNLLRDLPDSVYEGNAGEPPLVLAMDAYAEGRDWHGIAFEDAIVASLEATGARILYPEDADIPPRLRAYALRGAAGSGGRDLLAGLFWKALVRGSVQAAVYAIDSWRMRRNERNGR